MSSKLSAILDMLTNLQGDRMVQVEDQAKPMEVEKEVPGDDEVDAMEVYHWICKIISIFCNNLIVIFITI